VLRGKADGTFDGPRMFLSGPSAWKVVVSDFDRDGKPDFLTADYNAYEIHALSFVRGVGDGTFDTYRAFHTGSVVPVLWPGLKASGCVVADMNNDGKPDAVVIQNHPNVYPYDLAVLLNDGTGKLGAPILTDTGTQAWTGNPTFAIADVNHDGKLDAVVLSNLGYTPSAETFLGNGDGTFQPAIPFAVTQFSQPILADFDGDNIPDLMIPGNYQTTLQHGNGDGTFGAPVLINSGGAIFIGDLNGDGKPDYAEANIRSTVVSINDGLGHFTRHQVTTDEITAIAIADFDGDGKGDLLFLTYTGTQVRLGHGDGTFGPARSQTITPVPQTTPEIPVSPVVTGDFDGDGKLDVAIGRTIYLGHGDGFFSSRSRLRSLIGNFPNVADMDGNGSLDFVCMSEGDDVDVITTRTSPDPTATTSITLTTENASPAQYGQPVKFTATVTGGAVLLSGVIRFSAGGTPLALITPDSHGTAVFSAPFAIGTYAISATYTGDEFALESAATTQIDVVKAVTTLSISGNPNPQSGGRTVTIFVSLAPGVGYGFAPATGTITLREGATPLAIPVVNGLATTRNLSVGTHIITADYPGDANFESSSATFTQVITKPIPFLSVSLNPSGNITAGSPVTLHASFPGITTITGMISYYESGVLVGSAPLVNGAADLQTSFTWGYHVLAARYSGDDTWAAVESPFGFNVYVGPWGAPLAIRAVGRDDGGADLSWTQVIGGTYYTLWYRTSLAGAWQILTTVSAGAVNTFASMPANSTWEFAVSAVDANNNTAPMSAPDLATATTFTDSTITPGVTTIKAQHILDLRVAIQCVRTFAGMAAFPYTNAVATGQPIGALDVLELRTAVFDARATIGVPPVSFTEGNLIPHITPMRAIHLMELRTGVD
jgi:hypothetical protein